MMYLFHAFLILCVAGSSLSFFNQNCTIKDLQLDYANVYRNSKPILDDFSGVVSEFPSEDVTDIKIQKGRYLSVKKQNGKIIFSTTKAFEKFEEETPSQSYGQITFDTEIYFTCSNGSSVFTYSQQVIDQNNHHPAFNKPSYNFKYGMSLPKGFLLTKYYDIIATDIDLKSGSMKFNITGDKLDIQYGRSSNGASFARVTLLKDIAMPFDEEYTITVRDDGEEPYLTSTSKLRLTIADGSSVVVSPMFSQPLYQFVYNKKEKLVELKEEVVLTRGYGKDLKIKQIGMEKYFKSEIKSADKGLIETTLLKALSDEELNYERFIMFEIEAEYPGAKQKAKTTIFITVK